MAWAGFLRNQRPDQGCVGFYRSPESYEIAFSRFLAMPILDQALHKPPADIFIVAEGRPCLCRRYTRGRAAGGRNIYLLLRCRPKRNVTTSPRLIAALPVTERPSTPAALQRRDAQMINLNNQIRALEAASDDANSHALFHADQDVRDQWTRKALAFRQAADRVREKQLAQAA